jgi:hypothetical protein
MANHHSLPLTSDGITPNPGKQDCKKTAGPTPKSGKPEYSPNA